MKKTIINNIKFLVRETIYGKFNNYIRVYIFADQVTNVYNISNGVYVNIMFNIADHVADYILDKSVSNEQLERAYDKLTL